MLCKQSEVPYNKKHVDLGLEDITWKKTLMTITLYHNFSTKIKSISQGLRRIGEIKNINNYLYENFYGILVLTKDIYDIF